MNPEFLGNYKATLDDENARHNWYDSVKYQFPEGKVLGHRHPNSGGDGPGGWVANTAYVSDTVVVEEEATVSENARVLGTVVIKNKCAVYGNALVFGNGTLGNGTDPVSVFKKSRVFGEPSIEARADINSTLTTDGMVFGKVIIIGEISVTQGDDKGSVFGTYEAIAGNKYKDTTYPSKPQAHGARFSLKLPPCRGKPIDSATGFSGDTPIAEIAVVSNTVSTTLAEATDVINIEEMGVDISEINDVVGEANALVNSAVDLKTNMNITIDGIVQQAGVDFNFLDKAGNLVNEVTSSIGMAGTVLSGSTIVAEIGSTITLNGTPMIPGTDFIQNFDSGSITNLNPATQLPQNLNPTDVVNAYSSIPTDPDIPSFI